MKKWLALLTWRNFGILRYNALWQNLAALFYIGFTGGLFSSGFLARVGAFILFSTAMTGFGYLVNDLADSDLDRLHGKPNAFQGMKRRRAVFVTAAIFLIGSIFGAAVVLTISLPFTTPFLARSRFLVLWAIWTVLAMFYSLPPFRLKERGGWGLAATIAAQQTLPAALLFAAFGNLFSPGAVGFILFATARGVSSDVGHQMRDWEHDQSTQTLTFAVRRGYSVVQRVYAFSLEIERFFLGVVMVLLLVDLPAFNALHLPFPARVNWSLSPAWPLVLIYLPLLGLTFGRSWQAWRSGVLARSDPYDEARQARQRDALHLIHHTFPSVIVPFYLAVLATLTDWSNVIFILVLALVYGLYSPQRWLVFFPARRRGA